MKGMDQKTMGAFVIGLAIIGGTYTWVNFGEPRSSYNVQNQVAAPVRTAIAVTDNDSNGIEDWRDAFTINEPVLISESSTPYAPPNTVTGRLGINLFEDFVRAKNYGPFGRTQEEVVADTVNELARSTEQTLYGTRDVSVLENANDIDIENYGNAIGNIILTNNKDGLEHELVIFDEIITLQNTEKYKDLIIIADTYKNMRDDMLSIPIPKIFLKEHLDLINTYEAVYQDIHAMTLYNEDSAVTLLRIRRYKDDSLGLSLALENMYLALERHAELFDPADSVTVFSNFNRNKLLP